MRKLLILILVLAIAGALGYYYYYQKNHKNDGLTLYGNVDVRQVELGFRLAGRVNEMFFEEGDFVKAGSLMGVLDKQPYLDQVKQAEASLESSRASLVNSNLLWLRRQDLVSDGSISQEDFDNALTNKVITEANLKNIEAALAVATTNLSFTEVYAPIDGIILTRIREPGTVVKASDPIYTLSVLDPVWIRAFIAEPSLGLIYPGMEADIFTDTKGGHPYRGYVGFISPVAEFTPKTVETTQLRTDLVYRLRIYVNNPDTGLRQGMPVTVKLHPKEDQTPQESAQEQK